MNKTIELAILALQEKANLAQDNCRRARMSGYGWAPSYAIAAEVERDQYLAAIAELRSMSK